MGGRPKGELPLAGKTLLRRVIERVAPQVGLLLLSVESENRELGAYGFELVTDPVPGHEGPLQGLLAAMQRTSERYPWLLLTPCDAPFLPTDLAARLRVAATQEDEAISVVAAGGRLQPTFSLWHRDVLPALQSAVLEEGMAGFRQFLARSRYATLPWEDSGQPEFFNINDQSALDQAEKIIAARR